MGKIINRVRERQARKASNDANAQLDRAFAAYVKGHGGSGLGAAIGITVCLVAILAGVVVGILSRGG